MKQTTIEKPYISQRTQRATGVMAGLCALVLVFSAVCPYLPIHGEQAIYDAVIRLHVVANSNSEEDQADKMAVRDAVLEMASTALEDCSTREEAQVVLEQLIPQLETTAEGVLRERGEDHAAVALLGLEEYPTRDYDSFCFPAGEYLSLRVLIGEGEGENFWCVLFPPMCLSAATVKKEQAEDALISVGLRPDQYSVITETENKKYKLRFRILEWIQELGF